MQLSHLLSKIIKNIIEAIKNRTNIKCPAVYPPCKLALMEANEEPQIVTENNASINAFVFKYFTKLPKRFKKSLILQTTNPTIILSFVQ